MDSFGPGLFFCPVCVDFLYIPPVLLDQSFSHLNPSSVFFFPVSRLATSIC